MANCDEIKIMLGAYADGELTPLESDAVVAHLEQCGRCRQIVRDQQRVQHVLDSYQPPRVPDYKWAETGRHLRAELEGKGERIALKTRSRTEVLEPTPMALPSLRPEETRASTRRMPELPKPAARQRPAKGEASQPAILVMRVRPHKRHARFGWVAHLVGAAAAALVVLAGLGSVWLQTGPALPPPIALARAQDVVIMDMETDADYSVVQLAGDPQDVAAVWVVPDEPAG